MNYTTARALTPTHAHHFFGYYSICPWNADQTRFVCLESSFHDHPPEADESAGIGIVDTVSGDWHVLAQTRAWNLQQGSMLYWLPQQENTHVVFNDRQDARIVARILNTDSGEIERTLPMPVAALSHRGDIAASLNYARMFRRRRVVGYAGADDYTEGVLHPADDGLTIMDIASGDTRLIVTMARIIEEFDHPEGMATRPMWFNHVGFSPNDSRIFFLARYKEGDENGPLNSAMFTVAPDGSDLRKVVDYGNSMSHFEWRDDRRIIVTMNWEDIGRCFIQFTDGEDDHHLMDDRLVGDGHMTFSPDRRWLLADGASERKDHKLLRLLDTKTNGLHILGHFHQPLPYRRDIRCDLHPRWNRTGDAISFDSIHEPTRQVYVMDLELT